MDVFSLFAKISLDTSEYDKGLSKAKSSLSSIGGAIKTGFGQIAGFGVKAAKAIGVGVTAATGAVGLLTKASIDGYAEYEQLVGGVETLFKDSADTIKEYAENAYKTAGISANEYMATATSFSASLLQGLGGDTKEAARITDMAITDMSDNMNKMGTSMESIQNAYMAFSKQNYVLLDNLKLGYGGTKTEMERLLADAEKLSGIHYDISNLNEVYEAIHVIQQEMGITGTTALEAEHTISGSVASMKSAWNNLIVGLSDSNADLDKLMDNVVSTAEIAFNNILPVAEKAITSIAGFIDKIVPVISEKIPGIVDKILPLLLKSAVTLLNALVSTIPSAIEQIVSMAPQFIDAGIKIINSLIQGIQRIAPDLLNIANGLISDFIAFIENFDFAQAAGEIAGKIVSLFDPNNGYFSDLLSEASKIIARLVEGFGEAAPQLIAGAYDLINSLGEWLIKEAPALIDAGADLLEGIITGLTDPNAIAKMLETALLLIETLVESLIKNLPRLYAGMWKLTFAVWQGIGMAISNLAGPMVEKAKEIVGQIFNGIKEAMENSDIGQSFLNVLDALKEVLDIAWNVLTNWWTILIDLINGRLEIIKATVDVFLVFLKGQFTYVFNVIQTTVLTVWELIKNAFKTSCDIITGIVNAFLSAIRGNWEGALNNIKSALLSWKDGVFNIFKIVFENVKNLFETQIEHAKTWGKDLIQSFIDGIKAKFQAVKDTVSDIADTVKDFLGFSEPKKGPLSNFHTFAPDMMDLFAKGIRDNEKLVINQIEKSFDFADMVPTLSADTSVKSGAYGTAGNTYGAITININGYNKDRKELAQEVANIINRGVNRAQAVYA